MYKMRNRAGVLASKGRAFKLIVNLSGKRFSDKTKYSKKHRRKNKVRI